MATLSEVRAALETRLKTISGLRTSDVGVAAPNPPQATVNLRSFEYSRDFDGSTLWKFYIWIYVNKTDIVRAQRNLDTYLISTGETSVKEALESDADVGGTVDWVRVLGAPQGPSEIDTAGYKLLGIPLEVECLA